MHTYVLGGKENYPPASTVRRDGGGQAGGTRRAEWLPGGGLHVQYLYSNDHYCYSLSTRLSTPT